MRVTADLFSGRPNPSWELDSAQAEALASRLRALPSQGGGAGGDGDDEGGLGYRGLLLLAEGGTELPGGWEEMRIAGGRVVAAGAGKREVFGDTGRALEAWLAATAEGRLDPALAALLREEARG